MSPYTKPYCGNFPCEQKLPEKYYRVLRVIRSGNLRRSFNFCSLKCMRDFFDKNRESEDY